MRIRDLAAWLSPRYWALQLMYKITGAEWTENWRAWPHCCGQAMCWMHITSQTPWCKCVCRWCRIARIMRRENADDTRTTDRTA